jgi:AcrR family transcriptional regulator
MTDGKGDAWIEAGFKEIARSGVEGVRVEVLAKNLGVTKGGFYRRFTDRAALLDGLVSRPSRRTRRRSCFTVSYSARACCFSNAARASARN